MGIPLRTEVEILPPVPLRLPVDWTVDCLVDSLVEWKGVLAVEAFLSRLVEGFEMATRLYVDVDLFPDLHDGYDCLLPVLVPLRSRRPLVAARVPRPTCLRVLARIGRSHPLASAFAGLFLSCLRTSSAPP